MNLEEMWARLAQHQPFADRRGYGPEWARMCAERTEAAARAAARAADGAANGAADAARARLAWAQAADIAAWVVAAAVVALGEAVRWIKSSEEQG